MDDDIHRVAQVLLDIAVAADPALDGASLLAAIEMAQAPLMDAGAVRLEIFSKELEVLAKEDLGPVAVHMQSLLAAYVTHVLWLANELSAATNRDYLEILSDLRGFNFDPEAYES